MFANRQNQEGTLQVTARKIATYRIDRAGFCIYSLPLWKNWPEVFFCDFLNYGDSIPIIRCWVFRYIRNPVRHKDCGVLYGDGITQKLFLYITYFKLARYACSCL